MALKQKTIVRGDTKWTYHIHRATPKKYLCQTNMKSPSGGALWQSLKGTAATVRWWKEKTGQVIDACPERERLAEHHWHQGVCLHCGRMKAHRGKKSYGKA